jgi:hypothetical protein
VGKSSTGRNPKTGELSFGVGLNVSPVAASISRAILPHHQHHTHEKSDLLLRLLRQKARATRNKKPKEFYSIREVAGHYDVPPTTVSRIYTQLKAEGLLTSVWGSKTFIVPIRVDNALRKHGIVALPASLVSFCMLRQYRNFFSDIHDALWKFGLATQLLFYEENDAQLAMFAERLLKHKLDIVIWFLPVANCKETVARLLDHGIRVITVADSARDAREHLYRVDRERAIRDAFLNWRKDGIRFVTVLPNSHCRSSDTLTLLEKCLRDTAIPHALSSLDSLHLEETVAAPAQQVTHGIVFASSEVAVALVTRDPARFEKLCQRSRILLMDGPIDVAGLTGANLPGGVLELDTRLIAKTIVSDLIQPTRAWNAAPVAFHAKWVPRTVETLAPKGSVQHVTMFKRTGVGQARITA